MIAIDLLNGSGGSDIDLNDIYQKINNLNFNTQTINENINVIDSAIAGIAANTFVISNSIQNALLNEFDLSSPNFLNISEIAENLNGKQNVIYKLNCINCLNVNENFNSFTNASGSIYGDGLCFDNCFNDNKGLCNYVLSPEGLTNCFNNNEYLKANIEAYDLNNCLNNDSFGSLILDVRNLRTCLNNATFSPAGQYYLKADFIASCFNNFAPIDSVRLHVDAMHNLQLFQNCNIYHLNGYFKGDVATSCFNSMTFESIERDTTETHYLNRRIFLNYQEFTNCFNNNSIIGDCAIFGNVNRLNDCFNSITVLYNSSQYYSNLINANSAQNCFMSIDLNGYNSFSNSFNYASSIFRNIAFHGYSLNVNLNVQRGEYMFMRMTDALFNIKLNALSLYYLFNYINHTYTLSASGLQIIGYVGSLYSWMNYGNNIQRLSLSLNGNVCSYLLFHATTNQSTDLYRTLFINLDFDYIINVLVGMRSNLYTDMRGYINIRGGSVYDCFKDVSFSAATCRVDAQFANSIGRRATIQSLFLNGNEYTSCLTSEIAITNLNMNVDKASDCIKFFSVTSMRADCNFMSSCLREGTLNNATIKAESLYDCFAKVTGSSLYINCPMIDVVLVSCNYSRIDFYAGSSVRACLKNCTINYLDINADKYLSMYNWFNYNSLFTCGIHCPLRFDNQGFEGNTIISKMVINYPPEFRSVSLWGSNAFGSAFTLEIPNMFYVGPDDAHLSTVGIKINNNALEFVYQPGGVVSDMQKYCSNYTSVINAIFTNVNQKLILKHYIDI